MLKVAAFTSGVHDPSARFRVRQYIPCLQRKGVFITELASRLGAYPPYIKSLRVPWIVGSLAGRIPDLLRSFQYDVTLLQRSFISTYYTLEVLTKKPRVLDVDDAIWLHPRGHYAGRLAKDCDAVICGNNFLAEYFSKWNKNIKIIATAIDTERYCPIQCTNMKESSTIGWSGSSSGFKYLMGIEEALFYILNKHRNTTLRIIADTQPQFRLISKERINFIKWSPEIEVSVLQDLTIGIMPLDDSLWSRGKCSFKMLTYMACEIPVVVSPIGMNEEVLKTGMVGYGPKTMTEWIDCLDYLLTNHDHARQIGEAGRKSVLHHYSLSMLSEAYAKTLYRIGGMHFYENN